MRWNLNQNVKVKGVADIVFVVDKSGSMGDIIDSIQTHISNFVEVLINDPQSTVKDVRLGLVTHDVNGTRRVHKADFVTSSREFNSLLDSAPDGEQEFGLPAIDCALDFDWRTSCRRYIIFFSDEPVSGGWDSSFQNSKLNELAHKMADLHVNFIGFNTEDCPSYRKLSKVGGLSSYEVLTRSDLTGASMNELLKDAARTITSGQDSSISTSIPRNLYGL